MTPLRILDHTPLPFPLFLVHTSLASSAPLTPFHPNDVCVIESPQNCDNESFLFKTDQSELTGSSNLMSYHGLEHSYNKFSGGKKVKEELSAFLPNLPGNIDTPGIEDNRLGFNQCLLSSTVYVMENLFFMILPILLTALCDHWLKSLLSQARSSTHSQVAC